jgi:hypothetical protein
MSFAGFLPSLVIRRFDIVSSFQKSDFREPFFPARVQSSRQATASVNGRFRTIGRSVGVPNSYLRTPDSTHNADRRSLARSPGGWTKGSVRELTFL